MLSENVVQELQDTPEEVNLKSLEMFYCELQGKDIHDLDDHIKPTSSIYAKALGAVSASLRPGRI